MSDADEALLWARECWATMCEQASFSGVAKTYRRGDRDERLRDDANAYRAGAAASAERIKELEARVAELENSPCSCTWSLA